MRSERLCAGFWTRRRIESLFIGTNNGCMCAHEKPPLYSLVAVVGDLIEAYEIDHEPPSC